MAVPARMHGGGSGLLARLLLLLLACGVCGLCGVGAGRAHAQPLVPPQADRSSADADADAHADTDADADADTDADADADADADPPVDGATARPLRVPNRGRALLELAGALGVGAVWYYAIDLDGNAADWDFPSIEQRLTFASLRFDNNDFDINFLWHPLSGAAYYGFARGNALSAWEAFLYGFGTSLVWEYGLEFREKTSINDILVTPATGFAVGEFYARLGRYLGSAPRSGGLRTVAAWTLGFSDTLHLALDGVHPSHPSTADHLGYDARLWHDFALWTGVSAQQVGTRAAPSAVEFGMRGEFADLPRLHSPGRSARWQLDAPRSRLSLSHARSAAGGQTWLRSDALMFAYYDRRIAEGPGGPSGHALTVGTGLGFDYRRIPAMRGTAGQRVAITHLPGIVFDADLLAGHSLLRLRMALQPDFAGLDAPGYPAWQARSPGVAPKTVLRKQGYYYGFGLSAQVALAWRYRWLRARAEAGLGDYRSSEGYDRSQELVEQDVSLADTLLDYGLWLGLSPLGDAAAWYCDVGVEGLARRSRIDGTGQRRSLRRYASRVGLRF